MSSRSFNANSYKYGFSGKEKVDEISEGDYDFGARIYDADLGRTLSIDPHSGKYPMLSPYSMFSNNPILLIDKDGKDIGVSTTFNQDGSKVITIIVTGKVINNSSKQITEDAMNSYAGRLSDAIIKEYSMSQPGVQVVVKTDIKVAKSEVQITESDHVFRIVDSGKIPKTKNEGGGFESKGTVGKAIFGENIIYLDERILDNEPAQTGPFAGTGKTSTGDATLERTGPHELGHSAKLLHVADDNNLMVQTKEKNAGTEVKKEQVQLIQKYHNEGKLNKGKQEIKDK